ncbi:surfeit locus protein 1-like [Oscarella lobularis]|uniref:surfeit locus protein 1-like n=1 Tax=Oscarella lobularis TaxID=121494 RepID=UPI00331347F5
MAAFCRRLISARGRSLTTSASGRTEKKHLWLLAIPVTTFGLGTWQIFRLRWKLDLKMDLEKRTTAPPVPLSTNLDELLRDFEYRRVTLQGEFDHSKELYLQPRLLLSEGKSVGAKEPGAQVVTPFTCKVSGETILVNRGWVPKSRLNPTTRLEGQPQGEVKLTGFVRGSEKRSPFMPKNKPEENCWHYKDLDAMALATQAKPFLVDADATATVPGGPIGGQTVISLRNEHLQYIFTWYCLALITLYMWTRLRQKNGTTSTLVKRPLSPF